MVTLTRSGAEIQWENCEQEMFQKFSRAGRVMMPVSSSRVNCALHRAASLRPRQRAGAFNGVHRRHIKRVSP
jgi:hypothetical protein